VARSPLSRPNSAPRARHIRSTAAIDSALSPHSRESTTVIRLICGPRTGRCPADDDKMLPDEARPGDKLDQDIKQIGRVDEVRTTTAPRPPEDQHGQIVAEEW